MSKGGDWKPHQPILNIAVYINAGSCFLPTMMG